MRPAIRLAQASRPLAVCAETTVERRGGSKGQSFYAAVYSFHPDVAPYDAKRRALDDAVSATIAALLHDEGDAFAMHVRSLLSALDDPYTHLEGKGAKLPASGAAREQRVWRYHGYPPDVRDPYQSAYEPFRVGWSSTGSTRMLRHRLALEDGTPLVVRYSEPIQGDTVATPTPDPAAEGSSNVADPAYPEPGRRVIAGYRVRAVARYFHPFTGLTGEDWDQVLIESIPRLLAAGPEGSVSRLRVRDATGRTRDAEVGRTTERWWLAFRDRLDPPVVRR